MLTGLTKRVLEACLVTEMTEHLGYSKQAVEGRDGGNSRNGARPKSVVTEIEPVELDVPCDRDSLFEPQLVKKRQWRLHGVAEMVICSRPIVNCHLADREGSDDRGGPGAPSRGVRHRRVPRDRVQNHRRGS